MSSRNSMLYLSIAGITQKIDLTRGSSEDLTRVSSKTWWILEDEPIGWKWILSHWDQLLSLLFNQIILIQALMRLSNGNLITLKLLMLMQLLHDLSHPNGWFIFIRLFELFHEVASQEPIYVLEILQHLKPRLLFFRGQVCIQIMVRSHLCGHPPHSVKVWGLSIAICHLRAANEHTVSLP